MHLFPTGKSVKVPQMADPPRCGCSCGSRRLKNASLGLVPSPQRADVTPTSTGNGRCVARATQTSPQVTNDTTDATCPSPTPPPLPSRRNRATPPHGAFRCHQTDGTPQPHARSKREKASMWCVVSIDTSCWSSDTKKGSNDFGFGRECARARRRRAILARGVRAPSTKHRARWARHRASTLRAGAAAPERERTALRISKFNFRF